MASVAPIRTTVRDEHLICSFSDAIVEVATARQWLLGDDASAMATAIEDLRVLAHVIGTRMRQDDEIFVRATALLRQIRKRALRDAEHGLLDATEEEFPEIFDLDDWVPFFERPASSAPNGTTPLAPIAPDARALLDDAATRDMTFVGGGVVIRSPMPADTWDDAAAA